MTGGEDAAVRAEGDDSDEEEDEECDDDVADGCEERGDEAGLIVGGGDLVDLGFDDELRLM
jgi:hypothetical protein